MGVITEILTAVLLSIPLTAAVLFVGSLTGVTIIGMDNLPVRPWGVEYTSTLALVFLLVTFLVYCILEKLGFYAHKVENKSV